ncbi:DUF5615 family PIN-like protein [Gymnodinialimonas hymeniacidonis]|uniref:DUF5615 family PIN-like protein n=1 Tax=Gymnodinialimonas hymeniacidonis TaxID=3126508 RepID=UPI0034C66B0D
MFSSAWRFLVDQNVPEPLCKFLEGAGQDVLRSRDVVGEEAKDPVVAKVAMEDSRILISWDRDFGHQRFMKKRFDGLARIGCSFPEPLAEARFSQVVDVVDSFIVRHDGLPPEIKIAREKIQLRDILLRN